MGLLDNTTQQIYYQGNEYGGYLLPTDVAWRYGTSESPQQKYP